VKTWSLPVIDLESSGAPEALREACRDSGFFYVVGHGVDETLTSRLEALSRDFFAKPLSEKLAIGMEHGGRAWRGYFPVGGELTSGRPDQKEGLYFGTELPPTHPKVLAKTPLHGANLFPAGPPGFRETVLEYMNAMTALGHRIMEVMASSLELDRGYFFERYTRDPLVLFRIFNYPALPEGSPPLWGVGEHTDYGLLTILHQDERGGLQVRSPSGWIDAPPIPQTFVCNIGDMLDRMTGGRYRSTPHRVQNASGLDRLSFPFFFDPNWDAEVQAIETSVPRIHRRDDRHERWDRASVHDFRGTYGEYVINKVSRVFPDLMRDVL
jgi:isopenicillin N synthase-like dioxygenase